MKLWDDKTVHELVKSALVLDGGSAVMLAKNAGPANATEAARRRLGGEVDFSHLSNGYPIYRKAVAVGA